MTRNERTLRLFGFLQKLNDQRHLYSLRTAFVLAMPIMIAGAYATLINQLPIPAYQQFMQGLIGDNWRLLGQLVFYGTTQVVSLIVVMSSAANLASWYNHHKGYQLNSTIAGMLSFGVYVILTIPTEAPDSLPFSMTGVIGLFVAMAAAMVSCEMYVRLGGARRASKLVFDDPSPVVPRAFAAVFPVLITLAVFGLLRAILVFCGVTESLEVIVINLLQRPFAGTEGSLAGAQAFNLSTHLMWLFGIHGNNVLDQVAQAVYVPAMQENITAVAAGLPAPNLVTKTLFDAFVYMGGSGTTLALLLALLLFGRNRSNRTLMRFAAPNALFNINEPLIFGIPIVLNPIYAIPFVLTPVVMLTTTTLAMQLGLVPYTVAEVGWATPVFVSGYLATGSVAGAVLQLFNLALGVAIYAPFVRISERVTQLRFDRAYRDLNNIIFTDYNPSSRALIRRGDEVGAVARRLANEIANVGKGEMFLNYQPIMDAATGKLHSVEALLRWKHPSLGMVNPMVTVALAEESGRIDALGLWIMEQAIVQRAKWNKEGVEDFHVSVNVSTRQLDAPDFYSKVNALLDKYKVPPSQLQVEITETVALVDNETTGINLAHLSKMGVTIAMDDFGVGHSSLLYLRAQPITTLKIDGSLSREIVKQPANRDIIATIYDLCNLLKLDMIVEFVDNQKQLDILLEIGAHLIQGYFYSPPLPGDEIPGFIGKMESKRLAQTGE